MEICHPMKTNTIYGEKKIEKVAKSQGKNGRKKFGKKFLLYEN